MMETFYKNWLKKHKSDNQEVKKLMQLDHHQQQQDNEPQQQQLQPVQPSTERPGAQQDNEPQQQQLQPVQPLTEGQPMQQESSEKNEKEKALSDIVYENNEMQLIVEKATHLRQIKFQLEDHLFHMKIKMKNPTSQHPLLRDILNFLQLAFNFILMNIRKYYKKEDHNIAYLTLYQEPMISGLNTGGFDLQEDSASMVERVLKMLEQFLTSNQTLKLNETFKVYLKVLSIEHMSYKKYLQNKRTNKKRKYYGVRVRPTKKYNYFWALDVPDSYPNEPSKNFFKNKCLLTCTILGLVQNEYYKSNRQDNRFIYLQNINSTLLNKQNHAGNLLVNELKNLLEKTKLSKEGPYELESTVKVLSETYFCQFFIFDGVDNSNKILFQYPDQYDEKLIPIYLYQPNDSKNHVVFIRHLNSYFKANVKICLACKQIFQTFNYNHICHKKTTCFACRRFFCCKETYLHEKIIPNFCDKNIVNESLIICPICNVTCYSNHCYKGHKLICSGKGTFGYKCLKCNKFMYRYGNLNGTKIKNEHICGEKVRCKFCRNPKESDDHLCKLQKELILNNWSKLAFINFEQFPSNLNDQSEPLLVIIYWEKELNGNFTKYVFSHFENEPSLDIQESFFSFEYITTNIEFSNNQKLKQTQDFKRNIKNLQSNTNHFLLTDKILQEITKWTNTTFICQDEDSRSYMLLLNAFIRNGFCPNLVRNGRHILLMEIKSLNLRFLTSNTYLEGDEFVLAKQFNIDYIRSFFPYKFFEAKHIFYQGNIPDISYFLNNFDSTDRTKEKQNYVSNFQKQNRTWNFRKELLQYAELKLWLLMLSCLSFLKESLTFQSNLKNAIKFEKDVLLSPFSYPLCSLSGFSYKLYKYFFLNQFEIYSVKNEFGLKSKNVSNIEYEWASFMEFKYENKHFISAFNNKFGQKYFKDAIPDLYSPITKQAYFFHGCVFHGHFENCLINPNANETSKNPFGISYKDLNDKFDKQAANLLQNNQDQIDEVIYQWECHYKQLRLSDSLLKDFIETKLKPHPLRRLCPRNCVRGAFFDVYRLRWSNILFPNENLFFIDINGLYSYCAIKFKFMIGKYKILIGKELQNLHLINNKFFFNGNRVMGSILLTILPPQNLYFPFLMCKTKDNKTINTLCKKCAEKKSTKCNHGINDRAICDTFMISEIEFALTLGYHIIAIHESHIYTNSDYILKSYIQYLNFYKTKHSECLKNFDSVVDKENYCKFLNQKMELNEPFLLKVEEIHPNSQKRSFYKLMSNALFGKLEQKNDKSQTKFVNKQSDLEDIFFSENKIIDLNCINDQICQVQISPNYSKLPPNRKSNCYLGAQVTAFARQIIYEHVEHLTKNEAFIYQVDCDSIIFSFPKGKSIPVSISDAVGDFKFEIKGNILKYYSLGPKNYSLTFEDKGKVETLSKVRGLSLNNSLNENIFTDELFAMYIDQFLSQKPSKVLINQYRTRANFKRLKISSELEKVTFSNDISKRRIVKSESLSYETIPYGYKS
jgi:hypothetical protein